MVSTHIIPEDPGEQIDVSISKVGDIIYLHYNGGTKAFDRKLVTKLLTAFAMVLHSTDRAITATAARLEAERASRATPSPEGAKLKTLNLSDIGL